MNKTILLTNDDGIEALGLSLLAEALKAFGHIVVIGPRHEQSASSHSLTLRESIQVEKISDDRYVVSGTPTDCVLLGVQGILGIQPDLIVSGINHGPNMGEDVTYSGTVAAAIEGTILKIPSVAISSLQRTLESAEVLKDTVRRVISTVLERDVPEDTLLNVNMPDPKISPIKGVKITKLGSRAYDNILKPEKDSQGKMSYTIDGDDPVWKDDNGTDIEAVRQGFVSITPLHLDLTNYKALVEMERWNFNL